MRYLKPRVRMCMDCGTSFMAQAPSQKRCQACQRAEFLACKRKSSLRYYREKVRNVPTDEITCPHCGRAFLPRSWKQRYCSERCTDLAAGARYRRKHGISTRATRAVGVSGEDSKRTIARAPKAVDWMKQVEYDLQIADPTERFEASRAWSARQRAYARKLALRAIGWRGAAY